MQANADFYDALPRARATMQAWERWAAAGCTLEDVVKHVAQNASQYAVCFWDTQLPDSLRHDTKGKYREAVHHSPNTGIQIHNEFSFFPARAVFAALAPALLPPATPMTDMAF